MIILPTTANVPTSVYLNAISQLISVLPQLFPTATAEEPQMQAMNSVNLQETYNKELFTKQIVR